MENKMRFGNSGGIYRDIMKFSILWSKKSLVFHFILKFLIQNKTIWWKHFNNWKFRNSYFVTGRLANTQFKNASSILSHYFFVGEPSVQISILMHDSGWIPRIFRVFFCVEISYFWLFYMKEDIQKCKKMLNFFEYSWIFSNFLDFFEVFLHFFFRTVTHSHVLHIIRFVTKFCIRKNMSSRSAV